MDHTHKTHRKLNEAEVNAINYFKDCANQMIEYADKIIANNPDCDALTRPMNEAKTRFEEGVMFATKAISSPE
ncbi:DUF7681 family protein [Alterisphingorhabdus coralli]|uniref:Uncharacterized protein n=1 Tax=Alterisphingorhabdus coralli TaxID=3071408 RepID=A0AA97I2G2_9SPHN|nr:hypothetical protein [Parasphingorhabdus sp. SCSIO 66989]WOE76365.1 hypothetical protein RB602_06530 [Parasphingorhabdus sp. SCSIO 66989]